MVVQVEIQVESVSGGIFYIICLSKIHLVELRTEFYDFPCA